MGKPFSISQQVSLLVFLMIASKGAAGVTGAGLATLAGGLQSHRPDLVDGVGFNVGIDRFNVGIDRMMSEARALTTFAGNAVATVLRGQRPSDEARMIDADPAAEPVVESEVVPAAATAPSSEAVRDRGSRPRPRGGVPLALVADPP